MDKKLISKAKKTLKDEALLHKRAKQFRATPELLRQEYELIIQIEQSKGEHDHQRVRELTNELISVQKRQPHAAR